MGSESIADIVRNKTKEFKMIRLLVSLLLICAISAAQAEIYKCWKPDGIVFFSDNPKSSLSCTSMNLEPMIINEPVRHTKPSSKSEILRFRKHLKVGDRTLYGLVIEVKRPIAKIQTVNGEQWFRIEALLP